MKLVSLLAAFAAFALCAISATGAALIAADPIPTPVAAESTRTQLTEAGEYQAKDGVIEIDLSEYAGYSGLIVANHGMEPNPDSVFTKNFGIKVRLNLSETDSCAAINSGKFAATATTVDVLAVLGPQFQVNVPLLIGYSRGADGIIVRSDIKSLNDLKGKVVAIQQKNESEFFLRYLLREAGVACAFVDTLDQQPDPTKVNLICYDDPFLAGDAFAAELGGQRRLAACVTWAPKTTEIVAASGGKARQLIDNSNFLMIADVLVVNRPFAQKHPEVVNALVQGTLWGNQQVRANAAPHLATIGAAFKWDDAQTRAELTKVHLANLPENLAFFTDDLDLGGSFPDIFLAAQGCYDYLIGGVEDPSGFMDNRALQAAKTVPMFANEKVNIQPYRRTTVSVEKLVLNKQIHFRFLPEQPSLDSSSSYNTEQLRSLEQMLRFSVGSSVLLVGHVDPSQKARLEAAGGGMLVREAAESAMRLSIKRAKTIQDLLVKQYKIDPARIKVRGEGWNRPVSQKPEENMRVELNLLTIE